MPGRPMPDRIRCGDFFNLRQWASSFALRGALLAPRSLPCAGLLLPCASDRTRLAIRVTAARTAPLSSFRCRLSAKVPAIVVGVARCAVGGDKLLKEA